MCKLSLKSKKYIWIAFLVAFLPRMLFLYRTHTMSISGDEIFSMWPAAKLAGYHWEGVMESYRYYGYGYSVLFVPLMMLIKNPVVLYRCMVFLMILAQSVIAPISCHLMKAYLKIDDERVLCLSGIACSYLVAVRAVYTYPEFIYVLTVWLSVWVLLKLIYAEGRTKIIYTAVLFILLTYGLTVHSRGVALWAALAGVILFYFWVYRKSIVSIPTCVILGGVGYIASKKGIEILLDYLGNGQISQVSNTSVKISAGMFDILRDPGSWTAWLNIIMGQLNEALINTVGIAAAVVIILSALLWKAARRKKEIVNNQEVDYRPYVVAGIFCLLAVVITIGGQSVTWLLGVLSAMRGEGEDAFRAFTYFRYYGAYTGPLLMLGIGYCAKQTDMIEWVKGKALLTVGLLQGYWVLCILPLIYYYNGCVWSYAPYSFTKGFWDEIGLRSYLPGTLVIIAVSLLSYYLCYKKKYKGILAILCVILVYSYAYNAVCHEGDRGEINCQYVKEGCELAEYLQDEKEYEGIIYVENTSVPLTGQSVASLYQFNLLDARVVADIPGDEDEAVFFCYYPEEHGELMEEGYSLVQISDRTYAYIKGKHVQETVMEWKTNSGK